MPTLDAAAELLFEEDTCNPAPGDFMFDCDLAGVWGVDVPDFLAAVAGVDVMID